MLADVFWQSVAAGFLAGAVLPWLWSLVRPLGSSEAVGVPTDVLPGGPRGRRF